MYEQKIHKRPAGTLVEDVVFKYFPFWPLLLGLSILFLAASWLYIKNTLPTYEASATILLSDQSKGSDQNTVSESLNLPVSKNLVENELEVLHSRKLMEEVVTDLNLYAPIYKKGRWKDSIPSYASCPVFIQLKDPEHLKEIRKVPFIVNGQNNTVTINNTSFPINQFVNTPYGEMRFGPTKNLNNTVKETYYFTLLPVRTVANGNLKSLDATSSAKVATVVKVKMKDYEPKRAEDILNTLLVKYTQSTIDYKNQLAKNTMSFIDTRLNILTNNIKDVDRQVQNYKTSNGIVNLDDQGKLYMQNVTQNDQKLSDINIQLAALNQVEKYVTSKDKSEGIVPSSLGVNDPMLGKLLDRLYDSEMQYEKLKKTTAENNPMVQSIAKQIENIRPSILENIQSQRSSLLAGKNNISSNINSYNSVLQSIPKKEKGLIDVTRDQSVKNSTYAFLLQKREQAALAFSSTVPDSKIVDTAESAVLPVAPKKSVIYLIALGAAAALTLAYIFLRELFNGNLLFRKEIENYTDIPVLGEVSYYKDNVAQQPKLNLNRQLSKILTASGLFNLPKNNKILITSAINGEGKSFIASSLAQHLALSGKRVLLIDGDFANNFISKSNKFDSLPGLSDVLENGPEHKSAIQASSIQELYILPAGKANNRGSQLLLNGRLPILIKNLEAEFDVIIIDSTGIEINGDAGVFSQFVDEVFYIIRHNTTPKSTVKQLDYSPVIASFKKPSIIFNGVKKRGFLLNDYGYGYGYENRKLKTANA